MKKTTDKSKNQKWGVHYPSKNKVTPQMLAASSVAGRNGC